MLCSVETGFVDYSSSVGNNLQLSSPLRSVENTLPLASGTTMNGDQEPNAELLCKLKTEPFSDHYSVIEVIGRGKFASVKKCTHKITGNVYAAKCIRKRRSGKDTTKNILHEISMLEMTRQHPYIVDLVEVFESKSEIIIVTEYAAGGELFEHVVIEERFDEKSAKKLMKQILEGLSYLHDRDIVHLDVKPQNILLTKPHPFGEIKICDLGFARTIHSNEDVRDIIGTPDYVAPEVLGFEPIHTFTDMWSVGVLTYVMLTGCSPFVGETKNETFLNISQCDLDFPEDLFEEISKQAQDFISSLLKLNPVERLTASEALKHDWLQQMETPVCSIPQRPPFGSPVGCRRATSPPSPDTEPTKRSRCDKEETQTVSRIQELKAEEMVEKPSVQKYEESQQTEQPMSLETVAAAPAKKNPLLNGLTKGLSLEKEAADTDIFSCENGSENTHCESTPATCLPGNRFTENLQECKNTQCECCKTDLIKADNGKGTENRENMKINDNKENESGIENLELESVTSDKQDHNENNWEGSFFNNLINSDTNSEEETIYTTTTKAQGDIQMPST